MSRKPSAYKQRARRPAKRWGDWALVRGWVMLLTLAASWLATCAPGPFRRKWIGSVRRDIGKLEHAVRCLLLILRARPPAPKPLPVFTVCTAAVRKPRRPLPPRRFSVSLRGFSWYPAQPARGPRSADGSSSAATRLREDPSAALQRRLAALRAVFADPAPHAARIAAACRALGFSTHRLKALIPASELRQTLHTFTPSRAPAVASAHLDTS